MFRAFDLLALKDFTIFELWTMNVPDAGLFQKLVVCTQLDTFYWHQIKLILKVFLLLISLFIFVNITRNYYWIGIPSLDLWLKL